MTKGRIPKDEATRTGHRAAVGQGESIEVAPVSAKLVGAEPPAGLSPLACEVWRVCVTDMVALGHLREPDLLQLRNYSVQAAIAIECEATIEEYGAMMKEPIIATDRETGIAEVVGWKLKANPACKLHRESSNTVRLLASDLALTPMARIRGNLMAIATASIAIGIKDDLEADLEAEDLALMQAKKQPKKLPAPKKPKKTTAKKREKTTAKKDGK